MAFRSMDAASMGSSSTVLRSLLCERRRLGTVFLESSTIWVQWAAWHCCCSIYCQASGCIDLRGVRSIYVGAGERRKEIRAALERESRIKLHRYSVATECAEDVRLWNSRRSLPPQEVRRSRCRKQLEWWIGSLSRLPLARGRGYVRCGARCLAPGVLPHESFDPVIRKGRLDAVQADVSEPRGVPGCP